MSTKRSTYQANPLARSPRIARGIARWLALFVGVVLVLSVVTDASAYCLVFGIAYNGIGCATICGHED